MDLKQDNILESEVGWVFESPLDSDVTIADFVLRKVQLLAAKGRQACITNGNTGEIYNYADLEPMSRKIASALYKKGFRKGDTVIYSAHDVSQLHIFMLGVWRANGIVRSSYPDDIHDELRDRVLESESRWILCDEERAEENVKFAKEFDLWTITVIVLGNAVGCLSIEELLQDNGEDLPDRQVGRDDHALILPTSGTTGKSKGAVYDHKSFIKVVIAYQNFPFTDKPEEAFLSTSRPTHFTGSVVPFAFFNTGRRLVMLAKSSLEVILETIIKYKVYGVMSFPKNLSNLVHDPMAKNYDLSSLTFVCSTGQTVDDSVVHTVKKLPSVKHFFAFLGMTEAGLLAGSVDFPAMINGIHRDLKEFPPFNVGKLFPGNKLKIYDSEGKTVGVGQRGELVFYCPFMCIGYLNKEKETAATFKNGWIHTGDIGYYDENGWIYLVDREKELIKYFGNHIYPTELENILLTIPGVAQACVVAVEAKDGAENWPRAFVVLKESVALSPPEILEKFNKQVASYKHLRGGLYILDSIPVGKTGKTSRRMLADLPVPTDAAKKS